MQLVFLLNRLRRRKRPAANQELQAAILKAGLYLSAIFCGHVLAMHLFEGMGLGDAAWLTATTFTTVGYGDVSATTTGGRLATVGLLYLGGIFVLAKVAGDYFDYRARRQELKRRGEWDWNMHQHILIINAPRLHAEPYFLRLIQRLRERQPFRECPVQILSTAFPNGLPAALTRIPGVVQTAGGPGDPEQLLSCEPAAARAVIVLAEDEHDPVSDSRTFDAVHRLRELDTGCQIVAEAVNDDNRVRLLRAGATNVTRPMRAYPGMLVRTLIAPGSEQVVEDIFGAGAFDFHRFEVAVTGVAWKDVVKRLIDHDLGTAVAYIATDSEAVVSHPAPDAAVEARALLALVNENRPVSAEEVRQALGQL